MHLDLPDDVLQKNGLSEKEVLIELTTRIYDRGGWTLREASSFAGISELEFLDELEKRNIQPYYGQDDLASDSKTIEELHRDRSK